MTMLGIDYESSSFFLLLLSVATTSIAAVVGVLTIYRHVVRYHHEKNNNLKTSSSSSQHRHPAVLRPPHVTSWVPYLGSAIEMGKMGITEFIRQKSRELNSAVFTATIMGDTCVFIGDPEYLNVVFKNKYAKYLDSHSLQKDFTMRVLDLTKEEVKEVFADSLMQVGKSQYHHFLFTREELNKSTALVQEFFWKQFLPALVVNDQQQQQQQQEEWTQHEMFSMVFSAVFKATVGPFVSSSLENDETFRAFREFDQGVIAMFNKVPRFFIPSHYKARSYLMKQLASPLFWEAASSMMKDRRDKLEVAPETLQKANLGVLWASAGNSAPAIYWTLLRLLQDRQAFDACREQVDEVVLAAKKRQAARDGTSSTTKEDHPSFPLLTVEDLDSLTLLESAFWEVLRLYQSNFTARRVMQDFVLDTKTQKFWIQGGTKLMPSWSVLHRDPHVFEKPDSFQFDRFVDKKKVFYFASGAKVAFFPVVPFGGGGQLCPGRKFVSYEARLLLALMMINYDMRLAEGESIPGVDLSMQGIGVSQPAKEVKVEIRKRRR